MTSAAALLGQLGNRRKVWVLCVVLQLYISDLRKCSMLDASRSVGQTGWEEHSWSSRLFRRTCTAQALHTPVPSIVSCPQSRRPRIRTTSPFDNVRAKRWIRDGKEDNDVMISSPVNRYHGSGKKSCETRLRAWTLLRSPENGLGLAVHFNLFLACADV